MAKGFSDHEKQQIKAKLIEAYEVCLKRYGIQKISIDELVKMAGISKGSFYLFYESKEMLFLDVLDQANDKIKGVIFSTFKNSEGASRKDLLKSLILNVFEEMRKTPWLLNLNDNEYGSTLRRIPQDILIKHTSRDDNDISDVLKHYNIPLKINLDVMTAIYRTLFFSLLYKDLIGEHYDEAIDVIADGIISQIL
jgi:AcrR family transcriptional regulator